MKRRTSILPGLSAPCNYCEIQTRRMFCPIFRHLCEQLSQRQIPHLWLNNPGDREARKQISQNSVKLQSIHSSKGLQYKAVIVLWTDLLPNNQWDESEDEQRMLLYVALTRAEDYLFVSYSGESPFVS